MLLTFSIGSFALSPETLYQQANEHIFILETLDKNNEIITARSATLIAPGELVSSCEFLSEAASIRLKQNTATFSAAILHQDVKRNLCIFQANNLIGKPVVFATFAHLKVGSRVYAVSNVLNMGLNISEGVISALRETEGGSIIQHTASISPGSEGGALFDEEGKLVGILKYSKNDGQNINFASPVSWIGEIPTRASIQGGFRAWHDKALQLQKASEWEALAKHARDRIQRTKSDVELWRFLGYAEEKRKNWLLADTAYREAIKLDPEDIGTQLSLAYLQFSLEKPQAALDIANRLLKNNSENEYVWLLTYFAESSLGRAAKASDALEKAAQLAPWNEYIKNQIIRDAINRKDMDRMLRASMHLTQMNPGSPKTWIVLSEAYININQPKKALTAVEKALKVDAASGDAMFERGRVLSVLGRHKEAIASVNNGLANKPTYPGFGWQLLGGIYYGLKLYPEAIAAYRESIRIYPENNFASDWLAISLKDGGYYSEALALLEKAKVKRPEDPFVWRQIGFVNGYIANDKASIPALEKSLQIDSKQTKVWMALAEIYHRTGRREDVKRAYQHLLALDRELAQSTYKRLLLPYEENQ